MLKAPRALLERFIKTEASSGIILGICTIIALVIANSSISEAYFHFLHSKFIDLSIQQWVNDGLMAIFFFLIGLEIKRELIIGELRDLREAALPISAALGGMIVPALIYLFANSNSSSGAGWAIPTATDIAFALAVLTLLGKRVPLSLKVFLLTLAIVDDLGAVTIIATFYTETIKGFGVLIAGLGIGVIFVARQFQIKSIYFYSLVGAVVWLGVLYSGIHATIAGVILGLMTPYRFSVERNSEDTYSPVDNLISYLHSWVSFGIMPIFAISNAGIAFTTINFSRLFADPVFRGVGLGLLLGKPIGITLASLLAVRLGFARLPTNIKWRDLIGVSLLGGVGFTMAIFISNLALGPHEAEVAKLSVLLASGFSALIGFALLATSLKHGQKDIH